MIEIDKGVPLPPRSRANVRRIYPWREMEIGDSFFVPGKTANQMSPSCGRVGRELNAKFAVRQEANGVRVCGELRDGTE